MNALNALSLSRLSSPLKHTLSFTAQRRPYSQSSARQESSAHLSAMLWRHLEKSASFPKSLKKREVNELRQSCIRPLAREIVLLAKNPDPFEKEESEIRDFLKSSICQTMKEITARVPGSKKGIMYEETYFAEVYTGKGNYFDFLVQKNLKTDEFGCFKLGEDFRHFVTKKGFTASEAVQSFLEGPTPADCGTTVEVVYFKAMLDLLGKEKFNALFSTRPGKLQIRKWVCPDIRSSLYPFIEFVNPQITAETDPAQLELGDHICLGGVPWYTVKHPFGAMQSMHGIVIGFNEKKEALIGGLGFDTPRTIKQIKQTLVASYNAPQTDAEEEMFKRCPLDPKKLIEYPHLLKDKALLKIYTIQEVSDLGGCKLYNYSTCRLSSFVLTRLKLINNLENLRQKAETLKGIVLGRHIIANIHDQACFK